MTLISFLFLLVICCFKVLPTHSNDTSDNPSTCVNALASVVRVYKENVSKGRKLRAGVCRMIRSQEVIGCNGCTATIENNLCFGLCPSFYFASYITDKKIVFPAKCNANYETKKITLDCKGKNKKIQTIEYEFVKSCSCKNPSITWMKRLGIPRNFTG